MFAEEDKGVIFYETVITLKWQKHTYIECVPLPWEQYEDIPQYFKVIAVYLLLERRSPGTLGIHPSIRSGMVTAQKAYRLLVTAWRLPACYGTEPPVLYGPV
jgi:hypothetical protein